MRYGAISKKVVGTYFVLFFMSRCVVVVLVCVKQSPRRGTCGCFCMPGRHAPCQVCSPCVRAACIRRRNVCDTQGMLPRRDESWRCQLMKKGCMMHAADHKSSGADSSRPAGEKGNGYTGAYDRVYKWDWEITASPLGDVRPLVPRPFSRQNSPWATWTREGTGATPGTLWKACG